MLLADIFKRANEEKWAIGHFNFSTADQLKAFVEAASELKSPMMVGTSEGEAEFFGRDQAVALVKSYQKEGHILFLNSDHHKSWESAKAAVDAGYDTIHIDASALPLEENIQLTKKVVEYARSKNSDIMVEGELGYLRGSSEIQEAIEITTADFTKPDEAKRFVEETGVQRLAIAFGNIHGIVTKSEEHLDLGLLESVVSAAPDVFIVLHGGSGLDDIEVTEAIKTGVTNVHINTELRVVYHKALEKELARSDESTTPYKFEASAIEATKEKIKEKLQLFGSVNKL